MKKINSEMIILAREARGYTQKELAKLLGIAQGTLSKIEQGIQSPSEDGIENISEILMFPISFFEQEDKVYTPDLIYYRKRIAVPKKQILRAEALMNIVRMNLDRLLKSVDIPDVNLVSWNIDEDGGPEDAAIFLRQRWNLSKGRIDNLTKLVESNGIIVIGTELGVNKMDGISMFTTSNQPIIFINAHMPGDRQRLTIAHELGHLVLHLGKKIGSNRDEEKEAMAFAGELLMPKSEFISRFESIDLNSLATQKLYWLVSMGAILVRSKSLGLITDNQSQYIWKQMSIRGFKTKEPFELNIAKEKPTLVNELLEFHLKTLGFTKSELSRVLNISEKEIDNLYNPYEQNLRIVRN